MTAPLPVYAPDRRGPRAENREGLTYSEWLLAAGAIDGAGCRADKLPTPVGDMRGSGYHFSRLLRREWRQGVDPTEWRNYFDDEWATLQSWLAYKRQGLRAKVAAARLDGTYNRDLPSGIPENLSGDFFVHSSFRVNAKMKRTERWWEKPH